jgi:hypothetical protein
MGHNLLAINEATDSEIQGLEINKYAVEKSEIPAKIVLGSAYDLPWIDNSFDLVFTAGVLIHIPTNGMITIPVYSGTLSHPDSKCLEEAMKEMYRVSNKFIMMIEYPNEKEEGREYRDFGDKEGVWSRPYGKIFQELFPTAKLVKTGHMKDLGESEWGFTKDCDFWIFEK